MDKYEQLGVVGEGSYGVVMKCRHKETGQVVAIKKFLETEEDATVKKMALREIRMLKKLRHENLVSMLEVFRRRRRFYIVFEYVDRTVLEELEAAGGGLPDEVVRRHVFQLIRALDHCHSNNIIHRDVKPENVLVSRLGVVKLCDFGFARVTAQAGEPYTEYVATRWYRAPELLVSDPKYGPEVDIWAIGCLFAEMMTGDPLFPGESDIDQLYLIVKVIGKLSSRQHQLLSRRPQLRAALENGGGGPGGGGAGRSLRRLLPSRRAPALALLAATLRPDPSRRPPCRELLRHVYFTHDGFADNFPSELRRRAQQEAQLLKANPLLRKRHGTNSGQNRREIINQEETSNRIAIPEPPQPPSLPEVSALNNRAQSNSRITNQNSAGSAEQSSSEPQDVTSASPVAQSSSPVTLLQAAPVPPRLTLQPSPNKLNTRLTLHATINALPAPSNTQNKPQFSKRMDHKVDMMLIEDIKHIRGWEASQPLKSKPIRTNHELILPSVPGASFSPLKSSKIKLHPLEASLNIPSFGRSSDSNSPKNIITPKSLPYM